MWLHSLPVCRCDQSESRTTSENLRHTEVHFWFVLKFLLLSLNRSSYSKPKTIFGNYSKQLHSIVVVFFKSGYPFAPLKPQNLRSHPFFTKNFRAYVTQARALVVQAHPKFSRIKISRFDLSRLLHPVFSLWLTMLCPQRRL